MCIYINNEVKKEVVNFACIFPISTKPPPLFLREIGIGLPKPNFKIIEKKITKNAGVKLYVELDLE